MKWSLVVLVIALLCSAVLSMASFSSRQQSERPLGEFAEFPGTYLNMCVPLNGGCLEQSDMAKKPKVVFLGSIQKLGDGAIRSWSNVTNATGDEQQQEGQDADQQTSEEQPCIVNRVGLAFNNMSLDNLPNFAVSYFLNVPAEIFNESIIDHVTVDWYPATSEIDNNVWESRLYDGVEYFGYKFWFVGPPDVWSIEADDENSANCSDTFQLSQTLLAENFTFSNKCVEGFGAIYVPGDAIQNGSLRLMNISVNYALYGDMLIYVEVAVSKEYLVLLATPGHSDDTGNQSLQPPAMEQLQQLPQFSDIFGASQEGEPQNPKGAFPQVFRVRYLTNDLVPDCTQYQLSLDSFEN